MHEINYKTHVRKTLLLCNVNIPTHQNFTFLTSNNRLKKIMAKNNSSFTFAKLKIIVQKLTIFLKLFVAISLLFIFRAKNYFARNRHFSVQLK